MFLSLLKQRSMQIILLLTLYAFFAASMPSVVHQSFFSVSIFIKDLLLWMMPLTVCFFVSHTVSSFKRKAPFFIFLLVVFEALSNFSSVWYSYLVAWFSVDFIGVFLNAPEQAQSSLDALWRLPFARPSWWSADKGVFLGVVLGIFAAFFHDARLHLFLKQGRKSVEWCLTKVFAPLIPLFVLGFVARMAQSDLLDHVITHYLNVVLWLVVFLSVYVFFLFLLASNFSLPKALFFIKKLLPAGGMALTSSCSLSTMPWTIKGVAQILNNKDLAPAIIPATTNIQQIGDCIANTFLCFLLYTFFFHQMPHFGEWLIFTVVFVFARFATAAVLGGAIFIMLPIYESYLHFTPEMLAIIIAFNVILDPLITATNVVANGALAKVFENVMAKVIFRKNPAEAGL